MLGRVVARQPKSCRMPVRLPDCFVIAGGARDAITRTLRCELVNRPLCTELEYRPERDDAPVGGWRDARGPSRGRRHDHCREVKAGLVIFAVAQHFPGPLAEGAGPGAAVPASVVHAVPSISGAEVAAVATAWTAATADQTVGGPRPVRPPIVAMSPSQHPHVVLLEIPFRISWIVLQRPSGW